MTGRRTPPAPQPRSRVNGGIASAAEVAAEGGITNAAAEVAGEEGITSAAVEMTVDVDKPFAEFGGHGCVAGMGLTALHGCVADMGLTALQGCLADEERLR